MSVVRQGQAGVRVFLILFLVSLSSRSANAFLGSPLLRTRPGFHSLPEPCSGQLRPAFAMVDAAPSQRSNLAPISVGEAPKSAYIHIPFCKQKCHYCDFPIRVIGNDPSRPKAAALMEEYMEALAVEIKQGGGRPPSAAPCIRFAVPWTDMKHAAVRRRIRWHSTPLPELGVGDGLHWRRNAIADAAGTDQKGARLSTRQIWHR
eukprot:3404853-Rhodomonas_salina.1